MTAITIAPLAPVPFSFTDLGVLRKQECERVRALHDELTICGARVRRLTEPADLFAAAGK